MHNEWMKKAFISAYYVPGTVLCSLVIEIQKGGQSLTSRSLYSIR